MSMLMFQMELLSMGVKALTAVHELTDLNVPQMPLHWPTVISQTGIVVVVNLVYTYSVIHVSF